MNRISGYSAAEMVVALELLAMMSLIAVPVAKDAVQGYHMSGASMAVRGDLQRARMSAIMSNHRFRFIIVNEITYSIHADANNDGLADAGETVVTRSFVTSAPGVKFTPDSKDVTFAGDGSAPVSGRIVLYAQRGPQHRRDIVVNRGGRIQLETNF